MRDWRDCAIIRRVSSIDDNLRNNLAQTALLRILSSGLAGQQVGHATSCTSCGHVGRLWIRCKAFDFFS